MDITLITSYAKNAKKHSQKQIKQVAESIKRFGFVQPLVIDKNNEVVIGHCRLEAAKLLGLKDVPIISVESLTDEEVRALRLADNKLNESEWDMSLAIDELKGLSDEMFELTGFDKDLLNEKEYKDGIKNSLQEKYIVPPFSIWDTKQAYWQNRKRLWIEYIGYSGDGRNDNLLGEGLKKLAALTGTSIFDPVVAELSYRWFCPDKGLVLDPFGGGAC